MLGTTAGALNEAGTLTAAGSGAAVLNLTKAEGVRVDEAGAGAGALTGLRGLAGAGAGSGEGVGGVGEEEALSASMDARGGKHRRIRCLST